MKRQVNTLDEHSIPYPSAVTVDPKAEAILEEAFASSDVPWEDKAVQEIEVSRHAIVAMGAFLKARLNLDSSLPYYTYKSSFEFIVNQYNIIQSHLDDRIQVKGAVNDKAIVIYGYVKKDINMRLDLQRRRIDASTKQINDKTSSSSIEEMKGLFALVKPLIGLLI